MKKNNSTEAGGMRSEYDLASMKNAIRGKYAERFRTGGNIVLLEQEITDAFPSEAAVNEALRGILKISRVVRIEGKQRNPTSKTASQNGRPPSIKVVLDDPHYRPWIC